MNSLLRIAFLAALIAVPSTSHAIDLESAFNRLNHTQREYVQIRLRLPGFFDQQVDGAFGPHTEQAIRTATATPAFPLYRATARGRGIRDENLIAVYYVMSDIYKASVVAH